MKKVFYAIMVVCSAFFLVNAGMGEQDTLRMIPERKHK